MTAIPKPANHDVINAYSHIPAVSAPSLVVRPITFARLASAPTLSDRNSLANSITVRRRITAPTTTGNIQASLAGKLKDTTTTLPAIMATTIRTYWLPLIFMIPPKSALNSGSQGISDIKRDDNNDDQSWSSHEEQWPLFIKDKP